MSTDHVIEWIYVISSDSDWFVARALIQVEIPMDSMEWECSAIMVLLPALMELFNKRHCESPQHQDSKGSWRDNCGMEMHFASLMLESCT